MITTTQQGFFIRTRPHCVCPPHHRVFSSALVHILSHRLKNTDLGYTSKGCREIHFWKWSRRM